MSYDKNIAKNGGSPCLNDKELFIDYFGLSIGDSVRISRGFNNGDPVVIMPTDSDVDEATIIQFEREVANLWELLTEE